ncbi:MAG: hypothetical protein O3A90_06010 [Proteobacteria bacterium]|nr:hypothetical protein [Pseudomonadota bacterium]MDA0851017.1 hypothetical protein [Pseudomonadota bacterium]MDA1295247.1 hypothetical protein [Pseudomonadota bacterium]
MKIRSLVGTVLMTSTLAYNVSAQDFTDLKAELSSITSQLEAVDITISEYEGGLIQILAKTRKEALLLSKVLIENRISAAEGNASLAIQVPAVNPNEEIAQKLLGELAQQQKAVDLATQEAESAGGLIKALALSRVETEKLTLSQLQMAYLQAKYGIAFPKMTTSGEGNNTQADSVSNDVNEVGDNSDTSDPTQDVKNASKWVFIEKFDSFNDKNSSMVVLEASGYIGNDDPKELVVRCDARGGYEIFITTNGYIGARDDSVPVRYRFGKGEPISERWGESTSGRAAFLPKRYNDFRKNLATGEDFIFEITDFNGSRGSSEFDNSKDEKLDFIMGGCK